MRINKYLAKAGKASRRKADKLIEEKRVTINEKIAELSDRVNISSDKVFLDGEIITLNSDFIYYIMVKPENIISSVSDDRGRKTVIDFFPKQQGLFPVGRLDFDVSGVILITNDGELTYRLTHPKFGVEKIYHALISGSLDDSKTAKLKKGVELDGKMCKVKKIRTLKDGANSLVEVTMTEGRKREVKELLKAVGNRVLRLERISFAGIKKGELSKGEFRELSDIEVENLRKMVKL